MQFVRQKKVMKRCLTPDVKFDCGTSSEEWVSEDSGRACCLARRNAEVLESAEKSNVEVSVLSFRQDEGRGIGGLLMCDTEVETEEDVSVICDLGLLEGVNGVTLRG